MWMYSEHLPADPTLPVWDLPQLMRAYRLALKLCMPKLQNALVDALLFACFDFTSNCTDPAYAVWAWEHLPEGCKLQQAALDQLC